MAFRIQSLQTNDRKVIKMILTLKPLSRSEGSLAVWIELHTQVLIGRSSKSCVLTFIKYLPIVVMKLFVPLLFVLPAEVCSFLEPAEIIRLSRDTWQCSHEILFPVFLCRSVYDDYSRLIVIYVSYFFRSLPRHNHTHLSIYRNKYTRFDIP